MGDKIACGISYSKTLRMLKIFSKVLPINNSLTIKDTFLNNFCTLLNNYLLNLTKKGLKIFFFMQMRVRLRLPEHNIL